MVKPKEGGLARANDHRGSSAKFGNAVNDSPPNNRVRAPKIPKIRGSAPTILVAEPRLPGKGSPAQEGG